MIQSYSEHPEFVMSSSSQYPSLYQGQQLTGGMGSLQNMVARGGQSRGAPGLGQGLHSQGLQGRLTPTQFGNRGNSNLGMGMMGNPAAVGRNPLFSRKMGEIGSGPAAFDPSDFPSLAPGVGAPGGMPGRPNYVGMVKQPSEHPSEFQMSNEDFPALPGAPVSDPKMILNFSDPTGGGGGGGGGVGGGVGGSMLDNLKLNSQNQPLTPEQELKQQQQARKGIQTSPDGMVTNIPANMVVDQFGMIGLLTFIRAAETDQNLVSLALGTDLTTLGLNLNSEVTLFPTFGGPWAETPCRPQDIDFHVPHEYLTNTAIRDKLAPVKLNRYKDDILFFMFYTNVGDVLQLAAAAELYNRDWRYHKEERVWITRAPGMAPSEKTQTYERGTYYFFDVNTWRKIPKEFHLDYDKLEDRPSLPTSLTQTGPQAGGGVCSSPGPLGPGQGGL